MFGKNQDDFLLYTKSQFILIIFGKWHYLQMTVTIISDESNTL